MRICDSQVHSPPVPGHTGVNGIEEASLLAELAAAEVDRAVIVPITNASAPDENASSIGIASRHSEQFRVMALLRLADPPTEAEAALAGFRDDPVVSGIRISCYREPNRALLERDELDWVWQEAERLDLALMILASGNLGKVARIAEKHPGLRVIVDHLGLDPFATFGDEESFLESLQPLLRLSRLANVSVKASGLPNTVDEPWPFPLTHEPLRRVIDAFGAERTFWGSDLTRLKCSYRECVTHFTHALPFLQGRDLELVMGAAICDLLRWN
jgi:predicted TIM-barrel fold metal-dependent hydrolase